MGWSILRALAYKPQLTACYLRIKADAFQHHNFPADIQATIPLDGDGEMLVPFCTAFEGVPKVIPDALVPKIAAKVEIVLEEVVADDCVAVPEWVDLVFFSVTTLTIRGPIASGTNGRPVRRGDEKGSRTSPGKVRSHRNLSVQELILVRLGGSAARHLTSRVRLEGLHSLVLEWCVNYAGALTPLAHQPSSLRRLEVYSPSAAWYKESQARESQIGAEISLCDFIRSGAFELQTLHIFGGMFCTDQSLHNHLFFAIQTHLKSLRQLRVIASDEFDRAELREMAVCAPRLADLLIRTTTENLLVSYLPLQTLPLPSTIHPNYRSLTFLLSQPCQPTSKPSSPSKPSRYTIPRPSRTSIGMLVADVVSSPPPPKQRPTRP